jgi:signal transduction histidine kinase
LYLARKTIVEGHAGELSCETRLGEGTTFGMRLPQLHVSQAAGMDATA